MAAIMNQQHTPIARALHCDWRADDEQVYQTLKRATEPLTRAWDRIANAKRIALKFNQDKDPAHLILYDGHRQQLVDDSVARATLRLLRERTSAELVAVDCSFYQHYDKSTADTLQIRHVLDEFGVRYADGYADMVWADVPGGGLMFDKYPMPRACYEADTTLSIQKLKSHGFMGVTLTTKNLFGLMPFEPQGRPRVYYHHLVRMPYMLADLAKLYDPALAIIDGMVCQAGEEWGKGDGLVRFGNCLIAGDNCVATDAVGAHLMGHPVGEDWLSEPFHRDRNHLRVASEAGYGESDLAKIDWTSEVAAPVAEFFAKITDPREVVVSWRKTTAEQALFYRDNRALFDKYTGQYVLVQMGEVKWHDPSGVVKASRRKLAGDRPEQAMWMKFVTPNDDEGEHFEVYEKTLDAMRERAA
jgi:uncharacterized protein (DUF362 family)